MLKSICARCGNLLQYGQHCECAKQNNQERNRTYDKTQRNMQSKAIYQSKAWSRARAAAIARDNGLCLMCLSNKQMKPCDTVHHIEEIKEKPERAYDLVNLVSLCNSCHNRVHKAYVNNKRGTQSELFRMVGGIKKS